MGYEKQRRLEGKSTKGQASRAAKRKLSYGDYRFCRLEFTSDERDAARDWIATESPSLELINDWLGYGYSIKFSVGEDRRTVTISVTNHDPDDGDGGLILTGKGGSVATAWGSFLYKALVICADRSWKQAEHERGGSYVDIG